MNPSPRTTDTHDSDYTFFLAGVSRRFGLSPSHGANANSKQYHPQKQSMRGYYICKKITLDSKYNFDSNELVLVLLINTKHNVV